jgi:hypothetical protein
MVACANPPDAVGPYSLTDIFEEPSTLGELIIKVMFIFICMN